MWIQEFLERLEAKLDISLHIFYKCIKLSFMHHLVALNNQSQASRNIYGMQGIFSFSRGMHSQTALDDLSQRAECFDQWEAKQNCKDLRFKFTHELRIAPTIRLGSGLFSHAAPNRRQKVSDLFSLQNLFNVGPPCRRLEFSRFPCNARAVLLMFGANWNVWNGLIKHRAKTHLKPYLTDIVSLARSLLFTTNSPLYWRSWTESFVFF